MLQGRRSPLRAIAITASLMSFACIGAGMWWYVDRYGAPSPTSLYGISTSNVAPSPSIERIAVISRHPESASRLHAHDRDRLIIPVAGVKPEDLVDTFTQAREGGARVHDAIDIPAPLGTPVLAAATGSIEKQFLSRAGGKTIYIRSPDRDRTYYYAHLDEYAPGLFERMTVRQGQPIGAVGFSGNASPDAPHLHFEIMVTEPDMRWSERKSTINPYPLLINDRRD